MKNYWMILLTALIMSNCTPEIIDDGSKTNLDKMNELVISDPLVWNSLVNQSITIDTTGSGMKAGMAMDKEKRYPSSGYYYSIFEDLYPSQGDYDFNDVMLQTAMTVDGKGKSAWGTINTRLINRGGTISTRIGLMFYSVDKGKYTEIDSRYLSVNGEVVSESFGDKPFTMEMPAEGEDFEVTFEIAKESKLKDLWVDWFIVTTNQGVDYEIHSSGFPISGTAEFTLPQRDYLTINNLPWGLEIEAEEFFVPAEKALFLDAYPQFKAWAQSDGKDNKDWFKNPDRDYIQ